MSVSGLWHRLQSKQFFVHYLNSTQRFTFKFRTHDLHNMPMVHVILCYILVCLQKGLTTFKGLFLTTLLTLLHSNPSLFFLGWAFEWKPWITELLPSGSEQTKVSTYFQSSNTQILTVYMVVKDPSADGSDVQNVGNFCASFHAFLAWNVSSNEIITTSGSETVKKKSKWKRCLCEFK